MGKSKVTIDQCAEAIRNSGGFITQAARALGITQPALSKRIGRSEKLKEVLKETQEFVLDLAESKLIQAINRDEAWAICFYLKCKGKKRGYVEKQKIETKVKSEPPGLVVNVKSSNV